MRVLKYMVKESSNQSLDKQLVDLKEQPNMYRIGNPLFKAKKDFYDCIINIKLSF